MTDRPESETPRTDALQDEMIAEREEKYKPGEQPSTFFMDEHIERTLEHARQLERELSALTARERDALERAAKVCEAKTRETEVALSAAELWTTKAILNNRLSTLGECAAAIRVLTPSTGGI